MLQNYVAHFNATILEVRDLNESIVMSTSKRGLWNSHLSFSLDKKFLRNYAKLFEHAKKYAQMEEGHLLYWKEEGKKVTRKKWVREEETHA